MVDDVAPISIPGKQRARAARGVLTCGLLCRAGGRRGGGKGKGGRCGKKSGPISAVAAVRRAVGARLTLCVCSAWDDQECAAVARSSL